MDIFRTTTWTVRRYDLSGYDEEALDSVIQAWVKQQGWRIKRAPGLFLNDIMDNTYFIPPEAYNRGQASLAIRYLAPILYVYTSHHLPEAVRSINEEIANYADTRGGRANRTDPHTFSGSKLLSPHKEFEKLVKSSPSQEPTTRIIEGPSESRVPDKTRTPRLVPVDPGVTQKFGRKWTMQGTLNIEWGEMLSAELGVGGMDVISASVRGTIQEKRGISITKSEELTEETTLEGGEKGRKYELSWEQVWLKGKVEIMWNNRRDILPFEYLKGTEMKYRLIES